MAGAPAAFLNYEKEARYTKADTATREKKEPDAIKYYTCSGLTLSQSSFAQQGNFYFFKLLLFWVSYSQKLILTDKVSEQKEDKNRSREK